MCWWARTTDQAWHTVIELMGRTASTNIAEAYGWFAAQLALALALLGIHLENSMPQANLYPCYAGPDAVTLSGDEPSMRPQMSSPIE